MRAPTRTPTSIRSLPAGVLARPHRNAMHRREILVSEGQEAADTRIGKRP